MSAKSSASKGESGKSLTPEEIRHARRELNAWVARVEGTQTTKAELLGIKQGTLSGYMREDGFGIQFLRNLANVSHKTIDQLIGRPHANIDIALAYHSPTPVIPQAMAAAEDAVRRGEYRTPREWWGFMMAIQESEAAATRKEAESIPAPSVPASAVLSKRDRKALLAAGQGEPKRREKKA